MTRQEAVLSLMTFDQPLAELRAGLARHPFDWDGEPIATLRREHVLDVLDRWQAGKISGDEVEDWADLVEVRDDLNLDPSDAAVASAVFDLANPDLQGPLELVGPALLKKLRG